MLQSWAPDVVVPRASPSLWSPSPCVAVAVAVPRASPSPCVIVPRASLPLCIVAIAPQSGPLCDKVSKCFKQKKKKKLTICSNNASATLQKATSRKIVEPRLNASRALGKSKLTRRPKNSSTTRPNAAFALRKISNAKIQRKSNSPGRPFAKGGAYLWKDLQGNSNDDGVYPRGYTRPDDTGHKLSAIENDVG